MISGFLNLQSANDGTTKTVSVFAQEDASGGTETLTFQILNQAKTVQVAFAPNQVRQVLVTHTASGKGIVTVSATGSPQTLSSILDVDARRSFAEPGPLICVCTGCSPPEQGPESATCEYCGTTFIRLN
jgi:hypothetical protein